MITFELTMPNRGSWNGHWTGETKRYIRCRRECDVPKEVWNKDFTYSWSDGWTACVSVRKVDARSANKLMKISEGFCGYDWMISSIIRNGYIVSPSEEKQENKT